MGWLLGLLSPTIVNKIKDNYDRKSFFEAVKTELSELSFQLCITGFKLGQEYGQLDKNGIQVIKTQLSAYQGSEKIKNITKLLNLLLNASDDEFIIIMKSQRAQQGRSLSLKTHSISLLDSNPKGISRLPIEVQSKIYEFKNKLNIYNQEVLWLREHVKLTFIPDMTSANHTNVTNDIHQRYADLQKICESICKKVHAIKESKV